MSSFSVERSVSGGECLRMKSPSLDGMGRDLWSPIPPGERRNHRLEMGAALVEDVERVRVEIRCCDTLNGFVLVIDLEMALTKLRMRVVLMPANHELALRIDPLNAIGIMSEGSGEVERHVKLHGITGVRGPEEGGRVNRGADLGFHRLRRVIADLGDWEGRGRNLRLEFRMDAPKDSPP